MASFITTDFNPTDTRAKKKSWYATLTKEIIGVVRKLTCDAAVISVIYGMIVVSP